MYSVPSHFKRTVVDNSFEAGLFYANKSRHNRSLPAIKSKEIKKIMKSFTKKNIDKTLENI